jgi:hypothetical protein
MQVLEWPIENVHTFISICHGIQIIVNNCLFLNTVHSVFYNGWRAYLLTDQQLFYKVCLCKSVANTGRFLAAIAALYVTMSVRWSIRRSVGRCATSFKVSLNALEWGVMLKKGYERYIVT